MSFLVRNCRELENQHTGKELGDLIWAKDLSVVFIAETWIDEARLDRILHNINFDHKWEVPRGSRGGDSVLFWKDIVNFTIEDLQRYFINTTIDKNLDIE